MPTGIAMTAATTSMRNVPMIPLAIPPGTGSPADMAIMALNALGVGSVRKVHVSCFHPFINTSPRMASKGMAVSPENTQTTI